MKTIALLLAGCAALYAASPRITYSKDFPGSTPAFVLITVERDGTGVYKESVNDETPLHFKMFDGDTEEIFRLADKLERFTRPLESNLKVARMGMKTFRFEDGSAKSEQKFNYSVDPDAQALANWFERIVESELNYVRLERAVKYDKLGVNEAILLLQVSWERRRLVAWDQFLPLLDRVVKNDAFLHMARERAATLAETFRARRMPKAE